MITKRPQWWNWCLTDEALQLAGEFGQTRPQNDPEIGTLIFCPKYDPAVFVKGAKEARVRPCIHERRARIVQKQTHIIVARPHDHVWHGNVIGVCGVLPPLLTGEIAQHIGVPIFGALMA